MSLIPRALLVICTSAALSEAFLLASSAFAGSHRHNQAPFLRTCMGSDISRRQLLAAVPLSTAKGVAAMTSSGKSSVEIDQLSVVGYQEVGLSVGGENVPVSIWYPPDKGSVGSEAARYPHKISVGKIATLLTRGKINVPSFLGPSTVLSGSMSLLRGAAPGVMDGRSSNPAIIFAHGYLGSRFDMMHICEALAAKGFVVAAPEMPESLSASYKVNERVVRPCIIKDTVQILKRNFNVGEQLGIFGHSAGGGTSTNSVGEFSLGRVAIAGFRGYNGQDPLLVVASRGDGIIPVDMVKDALPPGCALYVGEEGARQALSGGVGRGRSAAVLFESALGREALPPNHISFLSEQTNDALVNFLSPLLPVARAIEVPVLDFDKYQKARDSKETARVLVPLVSGFFEANVM